MLLGSMYWTPIKQNPGSSRTAHARGVLHGCAATEGA
eukprot:IDg9531t1